MQRYLVIHEYDGRPYNGWQRQDNGATVQGALEQSISDFIGSDTEVSGSSRTDTGVHALGNACHVDLVRRSRHDHETVVHAPYSEDSVKNAINARLRASGHAVRVTKAIKVGPEFHARHAATGRTYFYRIGCGEKGKQRSLFGKGSEWDVEEDLDMRKMQAAADQLVGTHDFSTFRGAGCQAASPIKTLRALRVQEMPAAWPKYGFDGETAHRRLLVTATADGFLYHQVRLMVGLLRAVGAGKVPVECVGGMLRAKDITALPMSAPPHGLYLATVHYGSDAGAT